MHKPTLLNKCNKCGDFLRNTFKANDCPTCNPKLAHESSTNARELLITLETISMMLNGSDTEITNAIRAMCLSAIERATDGAK